MIRLEAHLFDIIKEKYNNSGAVEFGTVPLLFMFVTRFQAVQAFRSAPAIRS